MASTVAQRAAGAGAGRQRRRPRRLRRGGPGRRRRAPRRQGAHRRRGHRGAEVEAEEEAAVEVGAANVQGGRRVAVGLEGDEGTGGVAEGPEERAGAWA